MKFAGPCDACMGLMWIAFRHKGRDPFQHHAGIFQCRIEAVLDRNEGYRIWDAFQDRSIVIAFGAEKDGRIGIGKPFIEGYEFCLPGWIPVNENTLRLSPNYFVPVGLDESDI